MFTLEHKFLKHALVMLFVTLFLALFGAVYEMFSHEVYSYYMIYAFAIPLVLGVLPNLLLAMQNKFFCSKLSTSLWNFGVMTLTLGSTVKGVIDIYGTTNGKVILYLWGGLILLSLAIICLILERILFHKKKNHTD